jgi:hypothetical protein
MTGFLRNITRKIFMFFTAFAVLTINIPSLLLCSNMIEGDDCCHLQKTVKSCCIKHLKITFAERITGNCGCTIKGSQPASDMYIDLSTSHLTIQKITKEFEPAENYSFSAETFVRPQVYLPPIRSVTDTYLTNLNLRI